MRLYKNYVSRRLNPARYADPFIGRRSLEIQLQNLTRQLEEEKRELQSTQNEHRLIERAAKKNEMSEFEAEQLGKAVEEAHRIPALAEPTGSLHLQSGLTRYSRSMRGWI